MGSEPKVVFVGEALHPVDVRLHDVEQDDRSGGVDGSDQLVECSPEPVHRALSSSVLGYGAITSGWSGWRSPTRDPISSERWRLTKMDLGSVIASIAYWMPSRPMPARPKPPKGMLSRR